MCNVRMRKVRGSWQFSKELWMSTSSPARSLLIPQQVGCASFSSTLFPSNQLSVNMLGYSTLWTASFFGNECLWLTLLVKGVNDCLLNNYQISSLPRDCVALWTKLRDHFEGSGNLCRCFELTSWLACHHILICWDFKVDFYVMKVKSKSTSLWWRH